MTVVVNQPPSEPVSLSKDASLQNLSREKSKEEISTGGPEEIPKLKTKLKNQDRIMKEIKKQLGCYKQEITQIKKSESYMKMESYQKLVNDFNSLYDHFKASKQLNKKLKSELQQSN